MEPAVANIVDGLQAAGLIGGAETPVFQPLAGGVSCDVWKVDTRDGPIVVKRPLRNCAWQPNGLPRSSAGRARCAG
jgi:hypothetical protein